MNKLIKRMTALLMAAALLLCCTGCGESGKDKTGYDAIPPSTGGKDVERTKAADEIFSLNSNSQYSFNPLIATYHCNQLVCSLVYENMLELDNNFEPIPNVIKSWSCTEDGKLWTFKINTDYTFHDGTPVTGKDLRYSLDRAIYADRYAGRFSSYMGAAYLGDQFQVSLGIGDKQFVKLMNIPIIKAGDNGEKYPMGCGPYMFNEDHTQLLAYEGHPDYARLPVETIYLQEYPTPDGTISAFEDSIVDVAINDPSSLANLGYASTNESRTFPTTNMHFVAFNEDTTLGRYSSLRFALNYAFDRDYFVELLHGFGTASSVPMHPNCSIYPQTLADSLNYDLDKCVQVLYNAGIRDYDGDGKMEFSSDSSQKVELVFMVCSDSSAKTGVVKRFAEDMEKIGITVHVYALGWDDYMEALEEGEFEIGENKMLKYDMYYGEIKLRANFDMTELLQVREDEEDRTINYTNSKDGTYELMLNEYLAANDDNRFNAYYKFCEYLAQTGLIIPIGFEKQEIITHRGVVKGINANIGNPLYDFANWTIYLYEDGTDSRDRREAAVPVIYPGELTEAEKAEAEKAKEEEDKADGGTDAEKEDGTG